MATGLDDAGSGQHWHAEPAHQHLVQFYESDDYLIELLARYVRRTLANGEACIVVATSEHVSELRNKLTASGVNVDTCTSQGQLVTLDIPSTMSRFMDGDMPNPERFEALFGPMVTQAASTWGMVRVFGEMVALTAGENNASATLRLEELWNGMLARYDFTLCCAYPMSAFNEPRAEDLMDGICDQHSAVFPAESYSDRSSADNQRQAIAILQQRSARLSVEVERRKQIEDRLRVALNAERAARQEAESALRIRDEFLSIAAHELKTPLTSLIGRAQFVLRSHESGTPMKRGREIAALESIVGQANKLSRLINQLLDVSRLKGGKLAVERRPVEMVELINEAYESIRPDIEAFDVAVFGPDSLVAEVDPIRIEQVFVNVLNNAVKYSPEGGRIEITLAHTEENIVQITVRDYGPGIPRDERGQIFERFYQADRVEPRRGLGLGLYISREIVELHGGDIRAEFPEEGGTRIVIKIPRASASPESPIL